MSAEAAMAEVVARTRGKRARGDMMESWRGFCGRGGSCGDVE